MTYRWIALALLAAVAPLGCGGSDGTAPATVPPELRAVPNVEGLSLEGAAGILRAEGFEIGSVRVQEAVVTDPAVAVLQQAPAADAMAPVGSDIALLVSLPEDPIRFLLPKLTLSPQESRASAEAYYRAIDPANERTTLEAWRQANGFGERLGDPGVFETSSVYANDTDLGFGRHMFMRRDGDRYAYYVDNHESIDDAIDRRDVINTVAMEYGPGPASNGADPNVYYTKFFAFDANGNRVVDVDLDGRGEKFLPEGCLACHGGATTPPAPPGTVYPNHGNIGAPFIPFDLSTFRFSNRDGYRRDDQETAFRALNEGVRNTFARTFSTSGNHPIPDNAPGGVEVAIPVSGIDSVNHLDVGLDLLEHGDVSDLIVTLTSPAGTTIELLRRPAVVAPPTPFELTPLASGAALNQSGPSFVAGIALDSRGSVLFAEPTPSGTTRVVRAAPGTASAEILAEWPALPPVDLAVGAGDVIYVLGSDRTVSRIDPDTGARLPLALLGDAASALAWDPVGERLLVPQGRDLVAIDPLDGTLDLAFSEVLFAGFNSVVRDVDVDRQGVVWYLESLPGPVYLKRIPDPQFVGFRFLAFEGADTNWRLAVDPKGIAWIARCERSDAADLAEVLRVDYATGSILPVIPDCAGGVAATPDGSLVLLDLADLRSPGAERSLRLFDLYGGGFTNMLLEEGAPSSIQSLDLRNAPFGGMRAPIGTLAAFRGEGAEGTWRLRVVDAAAGIDGSVRDVSLHFSQSPTAAPRSHVVELIEGWHGGADLPSPTFQQDYLPPGWSPPAAPADARDLYFGVVARTCRLCHAQLEASFDFSDYDQFMTRGPITKRMVFDEGTMPLARRTFQKFWLSSFPPNRLGTIDRTLTYRRTADDAWTEPFPDQAAILAGFLADHFSGDERFGPGRPNANAGPDQIVAPGAPSRLVVLDGTGSAFDDRLRTWSQTGGPFIGLLGKQHPDGKIVSFVAPDAPPFTDDPVLLRFKLVVRRGPLVSEDEVEVRVEPEDIPDAPPLRFTTETTVHLSRTESITRPPVHDSLKAALPAGTPPPARRCIDCHTFGTLNWTAPSAAVFANLENRNLIDRNNPTQSRLLTYALDPTGHVGGRAWGSAGDARYVNVLQWITEGGEE